MEYYARSVVALFASNQSMNAWVYLSPMNYPRWKRLKPLNPDAVNNMVTMLTHAKAADRFVDVELDSLDQIVRIHVW
jgi:hypothetical protein